MWHEHLPQQNESKRLGWRYRWGSHQRELFWITGWWKPHSNPCPETKCQSILFLNPKLTRSFIKIACENGNAASYKTEKFSVEEKTFFRPSNLSLLRLHWHANSFHQSLNGFRKHTRYTISMTEETRSLSLQKCLRRQVNVVMGVTTSYIRKIKSKSNIHLNECKTTQQNKFYRQKAKSHP